MDNLPGAHLPHAPVPLLWGGRALEVRARSGLPWRCMLGWVRFVGAHRGGCVLEVCTRARAVNAHVGWCAFEVRVEIFSGAGAHCWCVWSGHVRRAKGDRALEVRTGAGTGIVLMEIQTQHLGGDTICTFPGVHLQHPTRPSWFN